MASVSVAEPIYPPSATLNPPLALSIPINACVEFAAVEFGVIVKSVV